MKVAAVDWDDTLYANDAWLPDAQRALKVLKRRGYRVVVHSCRAKYPAGEQFIRDTLRVAGFDLNVTAVKPDAHVYIDNKGLRHDGDWSKTLFLIRTL